MTNEEAIDYFKKCNETLVSVAKDENVYDYEKQVIEADCMRRTFEANEKVIQALEQMESSSEKPNKSENPTSWIPVSERLPKENEYIGDVCKYYLIQDEYGDMHVAHLSNVVWIPMGSLKAIGDEIIAWQELPESYKAESEDEEE